MDAEGVVAMCSVRAGDVVFGVPIMRILEIVGAPAVQPVPLAAAYIGGLFHYRGEFLTVISLRSLLDLPPGEGASDVLVCEGPNCQFGVLVDGVGEVISVPKDAFEPNPASLSERRQSFFGGVCKLHSGLMVALDPDRLDPMRLLEKLR